MTNVCLIILSCFNYLSCHKYQPNVKKTLIMRINEKERRYFERSLNLPKPPSLVTYHPSVMFPTSGVVKVPSFRNKTLGSTVKTLLDVNPLKGR